MQSEGRRRGRGESGDEVRDTAATTTHHPTPTTTDLNLATVSDLRDGVGVGMRVASLIVARQPFTSWEEIRQLPGIGEAKVQRLQSRFHLSEVESISWAIPHKKKSTLLSRLLPQDPVTRFTTASPSPRKPSKGRPPRALPKAVPLPPPGSPSLSVVSSVVLVPSITDMTTASNDSVLPPHQDASISPPSSSSSFSTSLPLPLVLPPSASFHENGGELDFGGFDMLPVPTVVAASIMTSNSTLPQFSTTASGFGGSLRSLSAISSSSSSSANQQLASGHLRPKSAPASYGGPPPESPFLALPHHAETPMDVENIPSSPDVIADGSRVSSLSHMGLPLPLPPDEPPILLNSQFAASILLNTTSHPGLLHPGALHHQLVPRHDADDDEIEVSRASPPPPPHSIFYELEGAESLMSDTLSPPAVPSVSSHTPTSPTDIAVVQRPTAPHAHQQQHPQQQQRPRAAVRKLAVFQRVNKLLQDSIAVHSRSGPMAIALAREARSIARHAVVRCAAATRGQLCRRCGAIVLPGRAGGSWRVRRGALVLSCRRCGWIRRFAQRQQQAQFRESLSDHQVPQQPQQHQQQQSHQSTIDH